MDKGRFSEAVTVTGRAKMVFLAGIGSGMSRPENYVSAISPRNAVAPLGS
jgi:hypothetical protein